MAAAYVRVGPVARSASPARRVSLASLQQVDSSFVVEWKSRQHLEDHFGRHAHEFPGASITDYDTSAQETLDLGTYFTYTDNTTGEERTGCYHRDTERLTILDDADAIISHYRCPERYVRRLDDSTYG